MLNSTTVILLFGNGLLHTKLTDSKNTKKKWESLCKISKKKFFKQKPLTLLLIVDLYIPY